VAIRASAEVGGILSSPKVYIYIYIYIYIYLYLFFHTNSKRFFISFSILFKYYFHKESEREKNIKKLGHCAKVSCNLLLFT
jgi:hypothetical protein